MIIPMKYTARFINGCAFKPSDWVDEGLPIIRIAQLTGGDFDNYFDGEVDDRYHISNGDLLFSWSATLDSFEWDRGLALLNQHIFKVIPDSGTCQRFLYYSLKHHALLWADVDAHGSTMRHIKKESLGNKIWLPEHGTQQDIADFLDRETVRIDKLVEMRKNFLSLIEEKKATLSASIVDGSILGGSPDGLRGWFGTLPNGWKIRRAKFLFRERQVRSETGEEELLTVSHITGVTKRSEKNVNMFLAESNKGYKLVSKGDVVINTMWAWMGAMGVSSVEGLISPSYGVYTPTTNNYEPDYFDLLLRSRPFVAEATRRSKGIHSSRLRLYPDAFLDTLIPLPSRDTQLDMLTALKAATAREERLAALSRQSLYRLREFRSALITAAVTGQIDVMTWGKRGDTDRRLDQIEEDMTRQEARA